jgi:hypothetical protein
LSEVYLAFFHSVDGLLNLENIYFVVQKLFNFI